MSEQEHKQEDVFTTLVGIIMLPTVFLAAILFISWLDWEQIQRYIQLIFLIAGIIYFIVLLCRLSVIQKIKTHLFACVAGIIVCGVNQPWKSISSWYFEEYPLECIGRILGQFLGASMVAAIGFWLSLIILVIVKIVRHRGNKKVLKQELAVAALEELNSGTADKYIWAQALVAAKGDETVAKAEYIKLRAK